MTFQPSSRGHIRFDLAHMAKAQGLRRSVAVRPIDPTQTQITDLYRLYLPVLRAWRTAAVEWLLPAYGAALDALMRDEQSDPVKSALGTAETEAYRVIAQFDQAMRRWMVKVEKRHREQFTASIAAATGVQIVGVVLESDAAEELALALERNTGLIRSVSDEARQRIGQAIWQGLTNRTPRREIAKQITEALDLGRQRSLRIAVDQTNKLAGDLDRLRQQQAGIDEFIWRHSGKVHYRPWHKARDGKRFKWNDPSLRGDLPKQKPFCGCTAQAYVAIDE